MASGVPVITSNTTSLPEVAGDAGILVNPKSTEEIAESINHILGSKNYENLLVEKGFEQVKKFSWETSAELVAEFYLQRGNG